MTGGSSFTASGVISSINNKILLLEPPYYRLFKPTYSLDRYPLALGYLAGIIKRETGWGVMACNADFSPRSEKVRIGHLAGAGFDNYLRALEDLSGPVWGEVGAVISEYKPGVLGISVKSATFASARLAARLAKEIDPRIIVLAGGPHPSLAPRAVMDCPHIDLCLRGEGEGAIVELLGAVGRGEGYESVPGLVFRQEDRVVENSQGDLIRDLDALPHPYETTPEVLKDYDLYPPRAFRHVMAVRGCPFDCFFCASGELWGGKVRFRSPESVAGEIRDLMKGGLRSIHFADDTFGVNREYIEALCRVLATGCPGLKWSCEIHAGLVDERTISLMKAAGCRSIDLGVESGSDEILKAMRKGVTRAEILSACRTIKDHGLELHGFFMFGFPRETEETLMETAELMRRKEFDQIHFSIFTPYPGTEAFRFCREKGLIGKDYDVSLYNHQSPANSFCLNLSHTRFRELVSGIEEEVDRRNRRYAVKRVFSADTLGKVKEALSVRYIRRGAGRT